MLVYVRHCLATTVKGRPCRNLSFVDENRRCPAHRDKVKFPISDTALDRERVLELVWEGAHKELSELFEESMLTIYRKKPRNILDGI